MAEITHRIRYPPFESDRFYPEHLPICENKFKIDGAVAPGFKLGADESWLVERIVDDDAVLDLSHHGETPSIIEKQRTGWYLIPNPIHARARTFINYSVVILLLCLFYLFTAPIQESIGIPTIGTGKVRLGLLDYPALAVIVVPLMFIPIALRVGANLGDLKRQNYFLNHAPSPPEIKLGKCTSGNPLKGKITLRETPEDWRDLSITWRVGILPPARHRVFSSLERNVNGQPPPGLTTKLPHHWEKGLDDGTGMGEDAPMHRHDVAGGVFLRPMRIMASGSTHNLGLEGGKFELEPPEGDWPGNLYGDLIRVHWELVVHIRRELGGPLLWVKPLLINHQESKITNAELIISDGRTESDTL
ncbi:MAG TPA: hypothetical protein EYQ73_05740 [Candidatus Poseidoniales archaeon]|jgi:hypothetical protein|nr:MAG: hypothetical protein CXT71_08330 [Euryarchaeota archaeon]HIF46280.1 hypothetical protein [Candidatus Poseidoniales archaeon]HIL65596.1 hypothetical protein [Candidatus Poseidoniales archaeon]